MDTVNIKERLRSSSNCEALSKVIDCSSLIWDEVRHIYRAGSGLVIYTKDGGRLHDNGDRIVAYKMAPKEAARRIIELCNLRAWKSISLSGSPEFVLEGMKLALSQGIRIVPTSKMQEEMLLALLAAQSGDLSDCANPALHTAAISPPSPPPNPTPERSLDLARTLPRPPTPTEPAPAASALGDEISRKLALRRQQETQRIDNFRKSGGPRLR
ncbi:MAG: hypothetical protein NT123_22500 [Proteobacteria bacterium]|nr:hypothetical protein [Pseudomonadota bacterium]